MIQPVTVTVAGRNLALADLEKPLDLESLLPGAGPWVVELGVGKGRFLLAQAGDRPQTRFLGVEVAAKYFRLCCRRAQRRRLGNFIALRGEALYLLSAVLPKRFASELHIYFPDPWPKSAHQKRRLFDPGTLDLVLEVLAPRGSLYFATDHLDYGEVVYGLLAATPGLAVRRRSAWANGPRTNYEAKYQTEGRPILRLEVGVKSISQLSQGISEQIHGGGAGLLA